MVGRRSGARDRDALLEARLPTDSPANHAIPALEPLLRQAHAKASSGPQPNQHALGQCPVPEPQQRRPVQVPEADYPAEEALTEAPNLGA